MQVITFKAKPKMIFGIILAVTGVIVILLTFVSNHGGAAETAAAPINCSTAALREDYLSSLGWKYGEVTQKEVTIPATFNQVYQNYNELQKEQGFNLENYKGRTAVLYTYTITNYNDNENVIANLLVSDGVLIGADLCDPSADSGFLVALGKNDNGTTG